MMGTVLEGFDAATIERMIGELSRTKENLQAAISRQRRPRTKAAAAA